MIRITSHVLDAVSGVSAAGIGVSLFRLVGDTRQPVFSTRSDNEGRVDQQIDIGEDEGEVEFELVFDTWSYLERKHSLTAVSQNMKSVVARFTMAAREQRYHMPLVLSPHSYTLWWSV